MPAAPKRTPSGNLIAKNGDRATTGKKKAIAKKVTKSHPSYNKLILQSLKYYNKEGDRKKPTSSLLIQNWIQRQYPTTSSKISTTYIRRAIQTAVQNKEISQIRSSYVIRKKGENKLQPKKNQKAQKAQKIQKKAPVPVIAAQIAPPAAPVFVQPVIFDQVPAPNVAPVLQKCNDCHGSGVGLVSNALLGICNHCTLIRNGAFVKAGLKSDHLWQYQDNGWKNYVAEASDIVEQVYQGYLANRGGTDVRAVKSGDWEYQVDFMAMKQTNLQHSAHTVRSIRRVPVS